jgi:hypothetical protein
MPHVHDLPPPPAPPPQQPRDVTFGVRIVPIVAPARIVDGALDVDEQQSREDHAGNYAELDCRSQGHRNP